ncbi:MAG: ribosome-associated translation inhibitor RaiA [Rikenellaceae bacterium]
MNIKIQSLKFDADSKLIEFTENKLSKLERFSDKIVDVEVIFKLDKDVEHGNKVTTITLSVPGDKLVAEHQSKTFEEGVDSTVDALKKQIEKYKTKH